MLVRKEQKWKWEGEQEEAFERLKAVFTTKPVLAIPDINREMRVEVDASDYATGGVLSTKYENGKWRLVVFISKSLNATEQNYKIHNKEILAVIRCLEAWRHYLKKAKLEFEIWTDHKNLLLSLSLDDSRTTRCECLGRTQWSSPLDWTTYLYYFYKWLYTTSPQSHVLLEYSTIT